MLVSRPSPCQMLRHQDPLYNVKEIHHPAPTKTPGISQLTSSSAQRAVWDSKPPKAGDPINWVELKTSAEMRNDRDRDNYERKLLKFWIQSFLLGVPRIIVGFRSRDGILQRIEDMDVASIPDTVARRGRQWDGNICTNFAASFLECESVLLCSTCST